MRLFDDSYAPYRHDDEDVKVHRRLGLTTPVRLNKPDDAPGGSPIYYLGRVTALQLPDLHNRYVDVYVQCLPARFFAFRITYLGGRTRTFTTGSGSLADHWPTFEQIATGRIDEQETFDWVPLPPEDSMEVFTAIADRLIDAYTSKR
jgi:hypothetical protein